MAATYNTVAGDPRGAAIVGFTASVSTLDLVLEEGMIDGRSVLGQTAGTMTAATTATKFMGCLLSEDGDGTFTITDGTDDLASAALADTDAKAIDVPAGGTGLLTAVVKQDGTVSNVDISVRGKLPPVSADQ